jgi:IS30 family transposase
MTDYTQLTQVERYQIEALLAAQVSQKDIAAQLGRSSSSISREVRRNLVDGTYCATAAGQLARQRRRDKTRRWIGQEVRGFVETLLELDWSPEQISGWLAQDMDVLVSHEWIYLHVYRDRAQGGRLHRHLRTGRGRRKRRGGGGLRGRIAGAVSIHARPAVVDRRGRFGDWEADTLEGRKGSGGLATLVERRSGTLEAAKLPDGSADEMAYACIGLLSDCPRRVRTITADNGGEFHGHADIAEALGAGFYFADKHSPWQRGCNENANGLLRQYFPKGCDFRKVGQTEIDRAVDRLNNRPRKRLGWKTPHQVLYGIKPLVALGS